jgi:myo-inositol 2-dehydrogenase/D-chiro-inositol 1-dehydrogenase
MAKRGPAEVRIGIAGGGPALDLVVQGYAAQKGVRVTALADPDEARARATAARTGIAHVFSDPLELAAAPGTDAIHVLGGIEPRLDVVLAACRSRKHVAVPKPLATTIEGARAIREAAEYAGVRVVVVDPLLNYPLAAEAKRLLDDGRVGEIQMIRIKSGAGGHGGWGPGFDPARLADPDFNPLLTPTFEKIAFAEHLLGTIREVFAYGGPAARMVTLKFDAPGRYGIHEATYAADLRIVSPALAVEEVFEISGTDGYLWLRGPMGRTIEAPKLVLKRKDRTTTWDDKTAYAFPAVVAAACARLVAAVRDPGKTPGGLRAAERAVRVNVAAQESCRSGKPVRIEE